MSVESQDRSKGDPTATATKATDKIHILLPFRVFENKTNALIGRLHAFTSDGCLIAGPEPIPVGTKLTAVFDLDRAVSGSPRLVLKIEVRSCDQAEHVRAEDFCDMNCRFLELEDEQRAALDSFVKEVAFLGEWLNAEHERKQAEALAKDKKS